MRTVMAFQNDPTNPYVPVGKLNFPMPPLLPGMYTVPSTPQPFPTPKFNKTAAPSIMSVQAIYAYERAGRMQY